MTLYMLRNLRDAMRDLFSEIGHTHNKADITDFPDSMTPTSHTHTKNDISNTEIATMVVTYTDDTTETVKLIKYTGD